MTIGSRSKVNTSGGDANPKAGLNVGTSRKKRRIVSDDENDVQTPYDEFNIFRLMYQMKQMIGLLQLDMKFIQSQMNVVVEKVGKDTESDSSGNEDEATDKDDAKDDDANDENAEYEDAEDEELAIKRFKLSQPGGYLTYRKA